MLYPSIGVRRPKEDYHSIPIGVIFVQICKNKKNVYYFPNNNFDYENLKKKLRLSGSFAARIVPYFKLKKDFLKLLRPAIIYDLEHLDDGESKQSKQEEKFFQLINGVDNFSLSENPDEQEPLSKFIYSVFHKGKVDPRLCLDCDDNNVALQDPAIIPAFNALGKYLVQYGIGNALKSEVLSIKTRLVFLNVIIDFLDNYFSDEESDSDSINSLTQFFRSTLREFDERKKWMNIEELTNLASTYLSFTDPYVDSASTVIGLINPSLSDSDTSV